MPSPPGSEMRVLIAAQQAVTRWRRSMPSNSFDRVLAEAEHDWWPNAPDSLAERHAFRQVAALLQDWTGDVLVDPDPLLALVRQTLLTESDRP